MSTRLLPLMMLAFAVTTAVAQNSPYAGDTKREIKALAASEIAGYLAGSGMGFARVAELNHYPGPKHVLELADELGLDAAQRDEAQRLYDVMHQHTTKFGRRLVDKERELDSLFASGEADEANVQHLIAEIAVLRGEVRFGHVKAHLGMKAAMTPQQIRRYDMMRGYTDSGHNGH